MVKRLLLLLAGCALAGVLVAVYFLPHTYVASVVSQFSGGGTPSPSASPVLFTPPAVPSGLPTPPGGTRCGGSAYACGESPTMYAAPSGSPAATGTGTVLLRTLPWTAEECRFAWGYLGADAQDDYDSSVRYARQGNQAFAAGYAAYSAAWKRLENIAAYLCGQPGPWQVSTAAVVGGLSDLNVGRQSHLDDEHSVGANSWDDSWVGIYTRLISLFNELPGGSAFHGG